MPNVAIVCPEGSQAGCMPQSLAYLPQVVAPTRDSRVARDSSFVCTSSPHREPIAIDGVA